MTLSPTFTPVKFDEVSIFVNLHQLIHKGGADLRQLPFLQVALIGSYGFNEIPDSLSEYHIIHTFKDSCITNQDLLLYLEHAVA